MQGQAGFVLIFTLSVRFSKSKKSYNLLKYIDFSGILLTNFYIYGLLTKNHLIHRSDVIQKTS